MANINLDYHENIQRINLDFVRGAFNEFLNLGIVSDFLLLAKLSCSFIIATILIHKLLISKVSMDELKPGDIIRPIILISFVFSFTLILDGLDRVFAELEKLINSSVSFYTKEMVLEYTETVDTPPAGSGPLQRISFYIERIFLIITHPGILIMKGGSIIFEILNNIIYSVALIGIFLKLFFLRILGPFAFIASVYHRFEGFAANWLRLYLITYSWISIILVVNLFSDFMYYKILAFKFGGTAASYSSATTMVYLCVLLVKVIFYVKSYQFLKGVFSNV